MCILVYRYISTYVYCIRCLLQGTQHTAPFSCAFEIARYLPGHGRRLLGACVGFDRCGLATLLGNSGIEPQKPSLIPNLFLSEVSYDAIYTMSYASLS